MICQETIDAVRFLSADAVQKAKSGHPGAPMGLAEVITVLFQNHLRHHPKDPQWINRDRFVLSNGHASMLLYSALHLSGYDLSIEQIKKFRQIHSHTAGHPELECVGVEMTTGPLGQGFASAVGMALAEKTLAAQINQKDCDPIIDHHTYVLMGDGCMMEGISHEAASLAGCLKLKKLIALWDDNGISIDGHLNHWQTEDVCARFRAYGWHVIEKIDGHDVKEIDQALHDAKKSHQPVLIQCKTQIAKGSVNLANHPKSHGQPLGDEELAQTRKQLNWPYPPFEIPDSVYHDWDVQAKTDEIKNLWQVQYDAYQEKHPKKAQEFQRRQQENSIDHDLLTGINKIIDQYWQNPQTIATRKASQMAIEFFAPHLTGMIGGSADLSPSNLTQFTDAQSVNQVPEGRYIHYGVREFAMAAMMNGLALHGGFIPFGGTFLVFSDYMRNAIRLSSMMQTKVVYVLTHDSIGVGEDGPTHQPVEHLMSLRLIPNLRVWRPCDLIETICAWSHALNHQGPSVLALSRQNLPAMLCDQQTKRNLFCDEANQLGQSLLKKTHQGAYLLWQNQHDFDKKPDLIVIATGSEVHLARAALGELCQSLPEVQNLLIQLVSVPCLDLFQQQSPTDQKQLLNPQARKIVIEAGVSWPWKAFLNQEDEVLGVDHFGLSGKASDVYEHFGLNQAKVVACLKRTVGEILSRGNEIVV